MAKPIQFKQIADLERGIKKAAADLKNLDRVTKSVFKSMTAEGKKLQSSFSGTIKSVGQLKTQFVSLNTTIEKDRAKVLSLNAELRKLLKTAGATKTAQEGLKKTYAASAAEVAKLSGKVKSLEATIKKLNKTASGKTIATLGKQLAQTSTQMNTLSAAARTTAKAFTFATGSFKALEAQNKRIFAILSRLPTAFVATNARAKALTATFKQNAAAMNQFNASMGRTFASLGAVRAGMLGLRSPVGQVVTGFTGLTTGIIGAALAFKQVVQNNAEFEDALAGVRKTTNLTTEEVRKLGNELKDIDTRTAVNDLLGIAKAAGRFQIPAENIRDFTEAVDQLTVALRDELGDDTEKITTDVTKIAQVFGLLNEGFEAEAITKIGSALNDLGNKTKAVAPFILDFTRRVQGVAATVDLSLPFVFGLGAALDEVGVTAEVSSTVLNKLFTKIGNAGEFERFARILGVTVEEYKELIRFSPEQALINLLTAARSNEKGFVALADVMGQLDVKGQRSSQVLSALTRNVDLLEKNVGIATDAFNENISIGREFEIQNSTLGASLDKLGNAITNLTTESTILAKSLKTLVDGFVFLLTLDFDKLGTSVFSSKEEIEEMKELQEEIAKARILISEDAKDFAQKDRIERERQLIEMVGQRQKAEAELAELEDDRSATILKQFEAETAFGGVVAKNQQEAIIMAQNQIDTERRLILTRQQEAEVFDQIHKNEIEKAKEIAKLRGDLTKKELENIALFRKFVGEHEDIRLTADEMDRLAEAMEKAGKAADKLGEEGLKALKKAFRDVADQARKFPNAIFGNPDTSFTTTFNRKETFESQGDFFTGKDPKIDADNFTEVLLTKKEEARFKREEKNRKKTLDAVQKDAQAKIALSKKTDKEQKAIEQQAQEDTAFIIQESIFMAADTANFLLDIRRENLARQLEMVKQQQQNELNLAGDNEEARVEIIDRFSAKERDIRIKQARAEKAQALFNIALNTAVGIMKAVGQTAIASAPFIAIIAALGAVQAGVVAAQPLPAFEKGGVSPGGTILVAEKGPELVRTGSNYQKIDKPSLIDTERGAQIFDAATTRRMEDQAMTQQTLDSMSGDYPVHKPRTDQLLRQVELKIVHSNKEVVNAIQRIPKITERLSAADTFISIQRRDQKVLYLKKRHRI